MNKQNDQEAVLISSLQNARIKDVVKLRKRSVRDEQGVLLVEGYREVLQALNNAYSPQVLFFCPALFLGSNERTIIQRSAEAGAELIECSEAVFRKIAYRDRPDGLLALAPQVKHTLQSLKLSEVPFLLVAESIEKPGNLGTMLRSADAAGVDAVIICDKCTDINNPNVVRASIGTLFAVPVVEASTEEVISWLKERQIQTVAATPHSDLNYTRVDLTVPTAVVVGSEQYGLHEQWMNEAACRVVIPMRGQADSLNVAAATTIMLYEVVRQRLSHP